MFFKKSSRAVADTHSSQNKSSGKNNIVILSGGAEPSLRVFKISESQNFNLDFAGYKVSCFMTDEEFIYVVLFNEVFGHSEIRKINIDTKIEEKNITVGSLITCCYIPPEKNILLFGTADSKILIFENGPIEYEMTEIVGFTSSITSVFSNEDVVAASSEGNIFFHDIDSYSLLYNKKITNFTITSISLNKNTKTAIIGCSDGKIFSEDYYSENTVYDIAMHSSEIIKTICFDNNCVSFGKEKIILWEISSGNIIQTIDTSKSIDDICYLNDTTFFVIYNSGIGYTYFENSKLNQKTKPDTIIPEETKIAYMFDEKYIVSKKKLYSGSDSGIMSLNASDNQLLFFYINETGNNNVFVSEDNKSYCFFSVDNYNTRKPDVSESNDELNGVKYSLERANFFIMDIVSKVFKKDMNNVYSNSLKSEMFDENIFYSNTTKNKNISLFFRDMAKKIFLGLQKNSSYEQIEYMFKQTLYKLDFFVNYSDLFLNIDLSGIDDVSKNKILWNIDMMIFYINNEFKKMDYKYISFLKKPTIEIFLNDTLVLKNVDLNAKLYKVLFYNQSGIKVSETDLAGPYTEGKQYANIKQSIGPGKYKLKAVAFLNKTFSEFSEESLLEV